MNSGYDECVRITRFFFRLLGVWPHSKTTPLSWLLYITWIFHMIFFVNIPQTMMLSICENFNDAVEILTTANIIIALSCLKLMKMWHRKEDLKSILIVIFENWQTTKKIAYEEMWKNVRLGNIIINSYFTIAFGTVIAHAMNRLTLIFQITQKSTSFSNTTIERPLFAESKFFFKTQASPVFEIIWFFQFFSSLIGASAFTSFDGFFILSILHACAQLAVLRHEIYNLSTAKNKRHFVKSLKMIVQTHLHLRRFAECIEDNFNKIFLLQMIFYSVTLCLQGYQLVISLREGLRKNAALLMFIAVFTSTNLFSLFIFCFVAEKLRTESQSLFFAIYEIKWYQLSPQETKMLINMLSATRQPIQLTAGKFSVLSYEYFIQVLKMATGYLSMLLAVKK